MNPLRSVGARLSLALLLCVTAALGLVYAAVAPSLESRLINSRLNDLERSAPALAQQILASDVLGQDFYDRAGTTTNSRVVLLPPLSQAPELDDECPRGLAGRRQLRATFATIRLAIDTSRDLTLHRSTVTRGGERYAEVDVPVGARRHGAAAVRLARARARAT